MEYKKFIEFTEVEKPILTAKKGSLGKKDSYKLNLLLKHKKEVSAPNYNQDQYPIIDLMVTLALKGKLYIKANDEKGKARLIKTPYLEYFLSLNEYEQYVFLLQTYWTKYPFEEKFDRWVDMVAIYNTLADITNSEDGVVIVKNENSGSDIMYAEGATFLHQLSFFSFGEVELVEGAKGSYEATIKGFTPNLFGIETSEFLLREAIFYFNRRDIRYVLEEKKMKALAKESKEPFEVLKNIFKDKLVLNTVKESSNFDRRGVYCFKVSLSKTLWRKISLSYKHTLGDFHLAIQEAFSFGDDHLYAFYTEGNHRNGKPIYCEQAENGGATAEKTSIADLELFAGQKMWYLFDFGDEWEFEVVLINIDDETPPPLKPILIETKGKAPDQYPDDDEDNEDDEGEDL